MSVFPIISAVTLRTSPVSTLMVAAAVILLFSFQSSPCQGNPFAGKQPGTEKTEVSDRSATSVSGYSIMNRISLWQMEMKQKISVYVRNFKKDGKIGPLLPIFLLAFLYGIIHSAGPGHGKGIAMAYTLSQGKHYLSGLLLGSLIAVFHAGSATALVLLLKLILEKSISSNLDTIARITQIISYGLITLLGLYIIGASLREFRKAPSPDASAGNGLPGKFGQGPIGIALAIGIVPCPGVIMILLFCLSLDQLVLGILLAAAVSCGMAVTITLAVWISLTGKKTILAMGSRWQKRLNLGEHLLHMTSGLLLVCIGGVLLAAAIQ